LVLLAGQTGLIYSLFKREASSLVATLICTVFLVGFAFAHLLGIGNYNYILSYNFELIHGLFFATSTLFCLMRWSAARELRFAGLAGLFFGLAALTKQEITLALSLAAMGGFILEAFRMKDGKFLGKSLVCFLAAGLVPIACFWACFAKSLGAVEALRILAWPWTALLSTNAAANSFHRAGLGLDDPMENLAATVQAAGMGVALVLLLSALCHRRVPKILQLGTGLLLMGLAWKCDWRDSGCGLPLFSLIVIAVLLVEGRHRIFPVIWALFGLGLLAKMGINCRIWHYGYVLAMPAALSLIFFLLKTLPDLVERHGINGKLLKGLLAGMICVGTLQLWGDSWEIYKAKTYPFGSGADTMLTFPPQANPRAEAIQLSVEWLKKNTPPQATLAAFPQGVILNYLARRPNPTPYLTWIVTEYKTFGEAMMLGSLKEHAPDYIALVHTDTSEYGPQFFGQPGYAAETMRWIGANYRPVFLVGSEPFKTGQFGVKLLKRTP
jgi:hypothetical protein